MNPQLKRELALKFGIPLREEFAGAALGVDVPQEGPSQMLPSEPEAIPVEESTYGSDVGMSNILRGAEQINQGFTGVKPDDTFYQNRLKMAQDKEGARKQLIKDYMAQKLAENKLKAEQDFQLSRDQADRTHQIDRDRTAFENQKTLEQMKLAATKSTRDAKGSIAEQAVDRAFAKGYADRATGEAAPASTNISILKDAISNLKSRGDYVSGPVTSRLPGMGLVREFTGASDIKNDILSVGQQSLRKILGAQFTEKDREAFERRIYNDRSEESVNVKRAEKMMETLQTMEDAQRKADAYFAEHGTLKGYPGHIPSSQDMFNALDSVDQSKDGGGSTKTVKDRQYSPSRNKTKIIYSDGSEEIVDGRRER